MVIRDRNHSLINLPPLAALSVRILEMTLFKDELLVALDAPRLLSYAFLSSMNFSQATQTYQNPTSQNFTGSLATYPLIFPM
ncbi:hypothetical protein L596_001583 [Steinernema carpocapsae]|uniref:Uncharacterized protein n=1 Tax=Steinernema carpocapsae TaxID=34508 RepID=A0A4U8UNN7_STECR|nr:hypothetical protein L596_001583 [Steinernema carpocapsae]